MDEFDEMKQHLDRVNDALAGYDPVLKERARDILLDTLFNSGNGAYRAGSGRSSDASDAGMDRLLLRWRPRKAAERALLSAYFLSQIQGEQILTSQAINGELKGHGLAVSNITRAIDANLRARPALMVQVKKMGRTRQARKRYEMTRDGIAHVEQRLSS